ncbi:SWIM zinc finger family protein [Streptomyces sp. BH-SS-21]|uniref:SWIM zinc finger family protein n=2 Tax=Streptomyces liliiviolaceus TaxID=2823109 RepID=A0A941BBR8_9ACTN|nr:SWIM zinc finger family protein [Streptomyces liliiviolaceus]
MSPTEQPGTDGDGTPQADFDADVHDHDDVASSAHGSRPAAEGTRPADAARRALREARRAEANADSGSGSGSGSGESSTAPQAPPGTGPASITPSAAVEPRRRAPEGTAAAGPRPGDAARAALRRAVGRHSGDSADGTDGGGGAPGSEGGVQPDARGSRPASDATATGAPARGSDATEAGASTRVPDVTVAGPPDEASAPPAADRPDAASETSRPGDVAREALRAARVQAERERTAAQDKGVGASRKRRGGAAAIAPGSRPTRPTGPSREAAAHVRELAEMLGNSLDLSSRLEREERADESDTGPGSARTHADADAVAGTGADTEPPASEAAHSHAHPHSHPHAHPHSHPHAEPTPGETPAPAQRSAPAAGRSMAAPARDGELRRTFPPPARARPEGGGFAETWWGNAWVTALEEMALDAARLGRGKAYAGEGHVDAVTVTPGLVLAYVHGSRPRPYRVQIRMRTLSDDDWERFLDTAAERPAHIAALLDKELPQALADCGVQLLPGPGDLVPRCSCPDSGHPCKHAAALCYQTARLLDEDPFVLLLLRGRGERELLDELSRRNATLAARSARAAEEPALSGVPAREAVERRVLAALPAPLPPPAHPEQPPAYPASPGGPDPFALDQLATDAAARAHALLTTGRDPLAELTLWQDAVRLAATRPGSGLTATTRALYADLATAARRTPGDLARAVAAWRQGGLEGLAVLEEAWDPPAGRFDRARPLLLAADFPAFRPWHNHLTHPHGHIQLRLGHDGLWYAYESEPGHDDWWPRGTPDLDPVGALTGLGSPTDV